MWVVVVYVVMEQLIDVYEIYIGCIDGLDCVCLFVKLNGEFEGVMFGDGCVQGSYLYGFFILDSFCKVYFVKFDIFVGDEFYYVRVESVFDVLVDYIEWYFDVGGLFVLVCQCFGKVDLFGFVVGKVELQLCWFVCEYV